MIILSLLLGLFASGCERDEDERVTLERYAEAGAERPAFRRARR